MSKVIGQGQTIDDDLIGPLHDSSSIVGNDTALRERMEQDGYIYLPQFFRHEDVMQARADVLGRLADVDEIATPAVEGQFTGRSSRKAKAGDLGEFWRSVSETWSLRRLSHGHELHQLMDSLLAGRSRVQDYIFLRPAGPGKHTNIHCDYPFFTRTTESVNTAWIALGDIPLRMGPLFIVEGSHRFQDVIDDVRGFDISVDTSRTASRPETPLEIAQARNTKLLTCDYRAGDIVVFNMFLLHGALDNISTTNEVRLSCDVRYQIASADLDPRYFGANPTGTTGKSYGELVGAKPMTEAWHQR